MVCFGPILKILGLSCELLFQNAKLIIKIHLNKKCEKNVRSDSVRRPSVET